jgi:glycosyltransferase involved in cell wall biosynthesis
VASDAARALTACSRRVAAAGPRFDTWPQSRQYLRACRYGGVTLGGAQDEVAPIEARRTISVLVPAYNEANNLEGAVRDVARAARDFDDFEILIVNDGSIDDTGQVAQQLAAEIPHVRVIHHSRNLGFRAAYNSALAQARMDYFTFVPGDHEVTLDSVETILAAVGSADLVVPFHATPWKRAWHRRALTWIAVTQLNWLFGWRVQYYQGPTVYPTALARLLPRTVNGFFYITEMLVHALDAGYSWVEVGLTHQERVFGRSKAVGWSTILDAQRAVLMLWWNVRVRGKRVTPRAAAWHRDQAPKKV